MSSMCSVQKCCHISCYAKKNQNYISGLYVTCEDHNLDNTTSRDPHVARVLLQEELENLGKQNKQLKEKIRNDKGKI